MKKVVLALVLVMAPALSTGCPELGIENPVVEGNTLMVHNQKSYEDDDGGIVEMTHDFLSVVKVSDECAHDTPKGINLLPEPLAYGESIAITGLDDGKYYCWIGSKGDCEASGYATLSGGNTTDWYVR
ncbi:MAG: hypothetical protein BWX80_01990 [Candidatus Hydrogenedentes bacterium ADurb.Bin101]|jgi:hypothetical protein|nr:MAG: hypothetical protein BWX80_01990 [Candidatus Hydrogenedentes bacterium ADurb.Bin101]